jgi:HSP20 family protein
MAKRSHKTSKTRSRKNSQALEPTRGNMLTVGISPFSVMKRFGEEMDRLFGDFGLDRNWIPPALTGEASRAWAPEIEIFERDGELVVRADLPGLKKEDVKVELTDEGLTIEGERRSEHEENGEGYYRSERNYGNFYRRLPLPEGANADDATAKFHDGVLEVTMPARKPVARAARKLAIQEGSQPKSKAKAA